MTFPIPSSLCKAQPGDIGNMHTNTAFGWLMGHSPLARAYHAFTNDDPRLCPSHSVLFVPDGSGRLCVGDVTLPTCKRLTMEEFARQIQCGAIANFRLFRPAGSTPEQGFKAAQWWNEKVHNAPYDIFAFPKLIAKTLFGDWIPGVAGMVWAWYCTEGNKDAWKNGGGMDVYHNENPTPVTTIKRWKEGTLVEII